MRMASHLFKVKTLLLFTLLFTLLPTMKFVLVTEEEATLLAKGTQDIFCFSRTFEDLTCFWNEPAEVNRTYRFFYTYKRGQSHECELISVKHMEGGRRHVCVFPSEHPGIQLFRELYVEVLDSTSHHIILSQSFSVDTVGLIAPPMNVKVKWPGLARQLHVVWTPPPINYTDFLAYEILYCAEGVVEPPLKIEVRNTHAYYLKDLLPGKLYHIQLRTKPDGISLDGSWGPWSPAVLAKTPHLPEEIGLHCFTPDLKQLHCQWDWNLMETDTLHSILYWAEDNSSSSRVQAWHKCEEKEERTKLYYDHHPHACTFEPGPNGYISVLVTVRQGQDKDSYFKEPFELHHVVLTTPPRILEATPLRGMLKLDWAPPLEEIAKHMIYQIQYALQDTMKWKILQVEYVNTSDIHLANGGCYCLQLRTQPDGHKIKGNWSAWSESLCLDVPPGAGSTLSNMTIILLLCAGLALGLGCIRLSIYSNMKQKLWPPVPDPHHALDGFFEDNSKQQQQVNAFFYNKSLDDTPLTCLFEILPEVPLETAVYDSLLKEKEWDNQLSSYQHYMVLGCNSLQESHHENAYFEGTENGHDAPSLSMEHDLEITLETKFQLNHSILFRAPLSDPEKKEDNQETSEDQSTSAMHISNQSYLLIG